MENKKTYIIVDNNKELSTVFEDGKLLDCINNGSTVLVREKTYRFTKKNG